MLGNSVGNPTAQMSGVCAYIRKGTSRHWTLPLPLAASRISVAMFGIAISLLPLSSSFWWAGPGSAHLAGRFREASAYRARDCRFEARWARAKNGVSKKEMEKSINKCCIFLLPKQRFQGRRVQKKPNSGFFDAHVPRAEGAGAGPTGLGGWGPRVSAEIFFFRRPLQS